MPEPEWLSVDYDPSEPPHTSTEILGRGSGSRKSKTWFPDLATASGISDIRDHYYHLLDLFRRLHAHHYTVNVEVNRDGAKVVEVRPHVLTDAEVKSRYPIVAKVEALHQEAVEHFASHKGFSVNRAVGFDEEDRKRRSDSSAAGGHRRPPQEPSSRWS